MTKALASARNFSSAGHRVILVESGKYRRTGHRFSRAVDRFYTVPDPTAPDYAAALLEIVQREQVDVYLPVSSPVASLQDARAMDLLPPACEVFSADADLVEVLDDKHRFAELAASLGLGVPRSHRITSTTRTALVERYVELGRQVRCGVIEQQGQLVCLPLEEYDVDPSRKPVRGYDDKIAATPDGDLRLVAKTDDRAWIVDRSDPATQRVWDVARTCHVALGCRQSACSTSASTPTAGPGSSRPACTARSPGPASLR